VKPVHQKLRETRLVLRNIVASGNLRATEVPLFKVLEYERRLREMEVELLGMAVTVEKADGVDTPPAEVVR
jgi:hypothetical protein